MERKPEILLEWLDDLKKSHKLIVVEGKKDRITLESLEIENIYALDKKPIYKCVEEISLLSKKVVILTDLDKEGKKVFGKLSAGLQNHGVEIDNYFREFLLKNTRLKQIEGIGNYLEKIK